MTLNKQQALERSLGVKMKNKFRKLILPASILIATQSMGLGLGSLQVDSNLDEALKGKIPLMLSEDEISDNIKVSLANEKDYRRVGLDKSYVPSNIKVSLVENEGEKFIKIYSKGPVSEPIVSLLLVVDWSNGHLLREFTLLLDPPLFNQNLSTDNYSEPVQTQKYQTPTKIEKPVYEDNSSSQVDYSNTVSDSSSSYSGSQQVTVEAGDTLWKIANSNRGGYGSTQQVMVAIFNNNPSAFQNNDMNFLKKGAVLTLPDEDQISSISNSQAISEVSAQTRQWSQLQTQDDYADTSNDSSVDYGIELVPPSDNDNSSNANGSSNTGSNTKLIAELSQAKEQLASTSLESDELSSRVQELEKIVEDQELALSLKDTDLAQLQQQLANDSDKSEDDVWNSSEVAPTTDEVVSLDDVALEDETALLDDTTLENETAWLDDTTFENETALLDDTILEDETALLDDTILEDETVSLDEETSSADEVAIKDTQPSQKVVIAPSSQEASFFDKVMSFKNELLMGLGALMLALIGFFFMKNRNKDDDVTENDSFLDSISETEESVSDLTIDDVSSDVKDEIENSTEELNIDDSDFDLDEALNNDTELNLSTLEEEVELAVDSLDIEEEPEVVIMDDEVDLNLDLDSLDIEEFDESDILENDSKEEVSLGEDNLDELDVDLGDELTLDLDLDESVDEELELLNTDEIETLNDDTSENEEFDFDEDLDLSLDDIDFDDTEDVTEVMEEDLGLSVDDTIQSAIDDLEDEATDINLETPIDGVSIDDESIDDLDIGFDLDDVVDDAIDTKLDLARAYFEMGDVDGAKQMVAEVIQEGTQEQQSKAQELQEEIEG